MSVTNSDPNHQTNSLLSKATVVLVKNFGSWMSVLLHSFIFISWFILQLNLEIFLVLVSLEAIYIGIFILMAENVETQERDKTRQLQRKGDMKVIKQDARIDEMSLKQLKSIKKQLNTIHILLQEKK